jgi:3-oxoacyl-[acyl-carrier-protein] synthase II
LDTTKTDTDRFGVVYGSPMLYADIPELGDLYRVCMVDGEFDFNQFGEQFSKQMFPPWLLKYLPNMTASHIGIAYGARGPNNSVVQGDVSSLHAIIEAATVIQRGLADVMLTGGTGNRLAFAGVVYRGDSNLSHRSNDPQSASRPFDADRDGMVIGEGAGTLVLEERQHAVRRGASILGTIVSHASTFFGSTGQNGFQAAIENSIVACLQKAGVDPADIGHVNAHGLSGRAHDVKEAKAIRSTLGDVPVTALKSYFGNVGAASGALELCASLLMNGTVPMTLNYDQPDPECDVNVVSSPQISTSPNFLKLSQVGTGQAAALLVRSSR